MPRFVVGSTYRNEQEAFRRFSHPSCWAGSHAVAIELLRHPYTTRILCLMFGAGLAGWAFTFLL